MYNTTFVCCILICYLGPPITTNPCGWNYSYCQSSSFPQWLENMTPPQRSHHGFLPPSYRRQRGFKGAGHSSLNYFAFARVQRVSLVAFLRSWVSWLHTILLSNAIPLKRCFLPTVNQRCPGLWASLIYVCIARTSTAQPAESKWHSQTAESSIKPWVNVLILTNLAPTGFILS